MPLIIIFMDVTNSSSQRTELLYRYHTYLFLDFTLIHSSRFEIECILTVRIKQSQVIQELGWRGVTDATIADVIVCRCFFFITHLCSHLCLLSVSYVMTNLSMTNAYVWKQTSWCFGEFLSFFLNVQILIHRLVSESLCRWKSQATNARLLCLIANCLIRYMKA